MSTASSSSRTGNGANRLNADAMIGVAITNRARKYLAACPGAIPHQEAHNRTFNIAKALVLGFALDESTALSLLGEWNSKCQPPWSQSELIHKIKDARKAPSKRPRGWLLDDFRPFNGSPRSFGALTPTTKQKPALVWPTLHEGTRKELAELARLRGLGIEGLELSQADGLLRFGSWQNSLAWFVTDPGAPWRIAQARRLDGQPWWEKAKSYTICEPDHGYAKWPIGASCIAAKAAVALCEGGPDLLAAYHFVAIEGMESECQPVCMLGAMMGIHEEALPLLSRKTIRIFPDRDGAGHSAAQKWARQLVTVGAAVDWFDYGDYFTVEGEPVKDLNDLAHMSAESFELHAELQTILPRG